MVNVLKCRHFDYTASGKVRVRELPSDSCLDNLGSFYGSRHFTFTSGGIARVGTALECCDNTTPLSDVVEEDCYPGGITRYLAGQVLNISSCRSCCPQTFELAYVDPSEPDGTEDCNCTALGYGYWTGSITLPGGNLTFQVCCIPSLDPMELPLFRVSWSGCEEGCTIGSLVCTDPFILNFGNILAPTCCNCDTEHTDQSSQINVYVYGRCRQTVWARHIGYTSTGIPVVARERRCLYDVIDECSCDTMTCGVQATITAVDSECSCMEGSLWLNRNSGSWGGSTTLCGHSGSVTMQCTSNEDQTVTLQLDVVCGADNVGTGQLTIPACDMDALDVIFPITMVWPYGGPCGTCTYQWNDMPQSWSLFTNDCTNGCSCGPEPATPGSFDGQQVQVACVGAEVPCCEGQIEVHVVREGGTSLMALNEVPQQPIDGPTQPTPKFRPTQPIRKRKGCGCRKRVPNALLNR